MGASRQSSGEGKRESWPVRAWSKIDWTAGSKMEFGIGCGRGGGVLNPFRAVEAKAREVDDRQESLVISKCIC